MNEDEAAVEAEAGAAAEAAAHADAAEAESIEAVQPLREITTHQINECNSAIRIGANRPGPGGASHVYTISVNDTVRGRGFGLMLEFQNGPIKEVGTNGLTHEALLAILEDRLASFQAGPYCCAENGIALEHIRHAQNSLQSRTKARLARGVEGTHTI